MIGWLGDIEAATENNEAFRTVLFTGAHTQLTVMRLLPGEEIGREVHPDIDQFIRVEVGRARVDLGPDEETIAETHDMQEDRAIVIPAGTWHNVVNAATASSSSTRSTHRPSTRTAPSTRPKRGPTLPRRSTTPNE